MVTAKPESEVAAGSAVSGSELELEDQAPRRMPPPVDPVVIRFPDDWELTLERFWEVASLNQELRLERTCDGELEVVQPPATDSNRAEALIFLDLMLWSHRLGGGGLAFTSANGYVLPDGRSRIPDCSWVDDEQLASVGPPPLPKQLPFAPRLVIEVRSSTDSLSQQQDKMRMWIENGVRLGWLVDPYQKKVHIYRAGQARPEVLDRPDSIGGEDVCQGLEVDLREVWALLPEYEPESE